MRKLSPVHYEYNDCYQDQIATIAEAYHNDYELSQIYRWKYPLNNIDKTCSNLNEAICNYWKNEKNYLDIGITVQRIYEKVFYKAFDEICRMLTQNIMILGFIGSDKCPWDLSLYKKGKTTLKSTHVVIITEYCKERNAFLCTDGWFNEANVLLSVEDFMNGYLGYYEKVKVQDMRPIDVIDRIKEQASMLKSSGAFEKIQVLAEIVNDTELCVEDEFDPDEFYLHYFYRMCFEFQNGRKGIAALLKNRYGETLLGNKFQKISSLWQIVAGLIVKAIMMNSYSKSKEKIVSRLLEIKKFEEQLAEEIINSPKEELSKLYQNNSSSKYFVNVRTVNISRYLNNNGFGDMEKNCNSRFTVSGEYFLRPIKNLALLQESNIKFDLSAILKDGNDNMRCNGQVINIDQDDVKHILILGCAEWGNYNEEFMHIHLHEQEGIDLGFSDWCGTPVFGEKIILKADICCKNGTEKSESCGNLYVYHYELEVKGFLKSIVMPECNNIHIFAISLA